MKDIDLKHAYVELESEKDSMTSVTDYTKQIHEIHQLN